MNKIIQIIKTWNVLVLVVCPMKIIGRYFDKTSNNGIFYLSEFGKVNGRNYYYDENNETCVWWMSQFPMWAIGNCSIAGPGKGDLILSFEGQCPAYPKGSVEQTPPWASSDTYENVNGELFVPEAAAEKIPQAVVDKSKS